MFRWTLYDLDSIITQVLEKDPRGYEGLTISWARDEKWHGIFDKFSNELGFFCKGAGKELMDAAYELKGQEANVKVKCENKCNGQWSTVLNGRADFSTYRQEYTGKTLYTYLNVVNEDFTHTIKSREDMEVDLLATSSLNGTALNNYPYLGYDITMHSKKVRLESEWETVYHGCCFRLISTGFIAFYIIPTTNILQGDFTQTFDSDSRCVNPASFDNFLDDAQKIVDTTNSSIIKQPQTVRITWNIAGNVTFTTYDVTPVTSDCEDTTCGTGALNDVLFDSVDMRLRVYFGNDTDSSAIQEADDCGANPVNQEGIKYIDLVTIPTFVSAGNPDVKYFANSGTRDIIINPGDKIWYYWVMDMNLVSSCDMKIEFNYSASELNILSDTTFSESSCKAIAIHEAWSRLLEIITDQNLAFYSEFFGRTNSNINYGSDGCGSRTAITSGKNIRGFDEPIKPSLKTMFESCDAVWGVGLGIEQYQNMNVIRVEEVDYFYSSTEILRLENIPNLQMKHLSDKVYNEINLGFKKWETQNVNGLDEPLTRINYVVPPIKNNKQKFEKLSDFVAGMYAIELTRRVVETTKDTSYDEDIFWLALNESDLTICEKDEIMQSISGLISPETAYNLKFLLSATFDRLKNQFVAGLTKLGTLANPVVMPAEGEGNEDVTYEFVATGCAGDSFGTNQSNGRAGRYPHAQARRDNPIWLPEEYTFDYPISYDQYQVLITNPYGLIAFSESDSNFKFGWITSFEYDVHRKSGKFTLIRKYG